MVRNWGVFFKATIVKAKKYHKNVRIELLLPSSFDVIFSLVAPSSGFKVNISYMKILLIEDDKNLAHLIGKVLKQYAYEVTICHSAKEALKNGLEFNHDLIILDLLFPDEKGEEFVIELRKKKINIPILVLSALSEVDSKIDLLKLGADDYMTKPFSSQELLARIEALERRCLNMTFNDRECYGDITFDWKQNKVHREGKKIPITKKEGQLLRLLVASKGETVRMEDILKKVWRVESGSHSNVIHATIRRLRKRIDHKCSYKLIRNVHGIGYCIVLPT